MAKMKRILRQGAVFLMLALLAGCMTSHLKTGQEAPLLFPPQAVMESGDYRGFLAQNVAALKSCSQPGACALAHFNLSFLYCYSKSPYYDPPKALHHISQVLAKAPRSPLAAQAMVWRDMILKQMKEQSLRRLAARQGLKSKQADLESKASEEKNWQVDRQILQDEIKSKDQIIQQLSKQLKGSQQIDLEMEKKEKRLLH
jgi:predicted small lipoprotein YifL